MKHDTAISSILRQTVDPTLNTDEKDKIIDFLESNVKQTSCNYLDLNSKQTESIWIYTFDVKRLFFSKVKKRRQK